MMKSNAKLLLCTDLDRTVLPNGDAAESAPARELFRRLVRRREVVLAYVTGRHKAMLQEGLETYHLPDPDYAIGDVGTTLYQTNGGRWRLWEDWQTEIGQDWKGRRHDQLAELLTDIDELTLQEQAKQNTYKLSYYAAPHVDSDALVTRVRQRMADEGLRVSLIWSIDEQKKQGLLDILPERATKYHAVRFLMKRMGFEEDRTVFAGDSGNDLPALTSGLQAVLVRNAHPDIYRKARQVLAEKGLSHRLYHAKGNFLGMNGNYAAGVLEGVAHFWPHTKDWLQA